MSFSVTVRVQSSDHPSASLHVTCRCALSGVGIVVIARAQESFAHDAPDFGAADGCGFAPAVAVDRGQLYFARLRRHTKNKEKSPAGDGRTTVLPHIVFYLCHW